jgi:putative transposase
MRRRKQIRLKGYDYLSDGTYFITICTKNREEIFGKIVNNEIYMKHYGDIVLECWKELPKHYPSIILDEFIVMPNHVHGIIIIINDIVGAFKSFSARRINEIRNTQGKPVWQRNYYDHIIRNKKSLNRIREYIITNSKRWQWDKNNPEGVNQF